MKGSLNTFLNAFTYPDRTCYPVASTNTQVGQQPRSWTHSHRSTADSNTSHDCSVTDDELGQQPLHVG
jgi:hypothetical protein